MKGNKKMETKTRKTQVLKGRDKYSCHILDKSLVKDIEIAANEEGKSISAYINSHLKEETAKSKAVIEAQNQVVKSFCLHLPKGQLNILRNEAYKNDKSVNSVILEAIELYIAQL